jgi:hypothetical protein
MHEVDHFLSRFVLALKRAHQFIHKTSTAFTCLSSNRVADSDIHDAVATRKYVGTEKHIATIERTYLTFLDDVSLRLVLVLEHEDNEWYGENVL